MNVVEYTIAHAIRGSCKCGKCFDSTPGNPQPEGHTANLTFMKIAANGGDKKEFLELVQNEFPNWLDGNEHSYIEIGAQLGDQGLSLMVIGLGDVLGAWKALSPDIVFPQLPQDLKMKMAGGGLVGLQAKKGENQ